MSFVFHVLELSEAKNLLHLDHVCRVFVRWHSRILFEKVEFGLNSSSAASARALEMFLKSLLTKTCLITQSKLSSAVSVAHM